jgi:hypothetical protein
MGNPAVHFGKKRQFKGSVIEDLPTALKQSCFARILSLRFPKKMNGSGPAENG